MANAAILAAFGQPVIYQQGAGDPFTVIGVLDKRTDEQRHPDTVYARLFVALSAFSVPPDHGDEVTIDGALYTVFEVQNDSAGGCWLSIREKI
ncbi:MAG: hypothetical protein LAQ69_44695 [Acidobacteriia bacterium]|nr:hypothetical protein [Terriglobia bacterium]